MIKYLDEIETEFENNLACLSGVQMGSNHEKTGGRKSCDTLPLRLIKCTLQMYFFSSEQFTLEYLRINPAYWAEGVVRLNRAAIFVCLD